MWSDPAVHKVGADLKAAILIAGRFGREPAGLTGDILLASYLLDPARYEQNLENVALHYLGLNLAGPRELAGRPLGVADLPPDLGCVYGASRAEAALNLWPILKGGAGTGGPLGALCPTWNCPCWPSWPAWRPGASAWTRIFSAASARTWKRPCSAWKGRFTTWPEKSF